MTHVLRSFIHIHLYSTGLSAHDVTSICSSAGYIGLAMPMGHGPPMSPYDTACRSLSTTEGFVEHPEYHTETVRLRGLFVARRLYDWKATLPWIALRLTRVELDSKHRQRIQRVIAILNPPPPSTVHSYPNYDLGVCFVWRHTFCFRMRGSSERKRDTALYDRCEVMGLQSLATY